MAEQPRKVTYYVVLGFTAGEDGPVPDDPKEVPSAGAACRLADALKASKAGVIAFSRTGDVELGEFEDAVVLRQHGDLPDELGEMSAA